MLEYWTSASSVAQYTTPTATHGSLQERVKVRKDETSSLLYFLLLISFQPYPWDIKTEEIQMAFRFYCGRRPMRRILKEFNCLANLIGFQYTSSSPLTQMLSRERPWEPRPPQSWVDMKKAHTESAPLSSVHPEINQGVGLENNRRNQRSLAMGGCMYEY